jgi:hypothetical protein
MDINTTEYRVNFDPQTTTIHCQGSLRLNGMEEYAPITQLFNHVAAMEPPVITFNLRNLSFLNSSGINVLSKFVIKVRQNKNIQIVVQGSSQIPWQGKSLKNLQRLMPTLTLELE